MTSSSSGLASAALIASISISASISPPAHGQSSLSYRIVEQWTIPAGGYGKAIVVKLHPSEAELRSLGDKLRKDTQGDKFAFVYVFDDERAARNRRLGISQKLSRADQHHYDAHFMGSYTRNGKTGYHQFNMMPKGLDGPTIEAEY